MLLSACRVSASMPPGTKCMEASTPTWPDIGKAPCRRAPLQKRAGPSLLLDSDIQRRVLCHAHRKPPEIDNPGLHRPLETPRDIEQVRHGAINYRLKLCISAQAASSNSAAGAVPLSHVSSLG